MAQPFTKSEVQAQGDAGHADQARFNSTTTMFSSEGGRSISDANGITRDAQHKSSSQCKVHLQGVLKACQSQILPAHVVEKLDQGRKRFVRRSRDQDDGQEIAKSFAGRRPRGLVSVMAYTRYQRRSEDVDSDSDSSDCNMFGTPDDYVPRRAFIRAAPMDHLDQDEP